MTVTATVIVNAEMNKNLHRLAVTIATTMICRHGLAMMLNTGILVSSRKLHGLAVTVITAVICHHGLAVITVMVVITWYFAGTLVLRFVILLVKV